MTATEYAAPTPPATMDTSRMEAFSDGVLAIIITIMVLELRVPHGVTLASLRPLAPVFASYILSFVYIGIYWNNHHHMLHVTKRVEGGILWANLHLLFWLSLVPFVTGWMGENHFAPAPTATYGMVLLMAAIAYWILQRRIITIQGSDSLLARAVGRDLKGKLSPLFYIVAIPSAFVNGWIAGALYVAVAIMWLVPDRRIERVLSARTGALVLLAGVALTACDDGVGVAGVGGQTGASVRFVNATGGAIDLTSNGQVIPGDGHILAGATSSCVDVTANAGLGIRETGAPSDLPGFAPTFAVGGRYTVIVFPGLSGATQVATLSGTFTPAVGRSGLRIFDALSSADVYDVYVTAPGAPLGLAGAAGLSSGTGTAFFDVAAGTSQIRLTFAATQAVAVDAGNVTLVAGDSPTLVLVSPAGTSTASILRAPPC